MIDTPQNRGGRPPMPEDLARSERVVTFLTPGERRALGKLAEETNQSLSAVCHDLIAEGLTQHTAANPED